MNDADTVRDLWRLNRAVAEVVVLSALSTTPRRVRDIVHRRATINALLVILTANRLDC